MINKDSKFFELFDKNQRANEKLKDYIFSGITIVADKKLKNLLDRDREAYKNLSDLLNSK